MSHGSAYRYFLLFSISYLLCLGAFYLLVGGYVVGGSLNKSTRLDLSGKAVGSDFVAYWAASKVARSQGPAAVFSRQSIYRAEWEVIGAEINPRIWNYPPTFLLMVLPLSLLPYLASFLSWLTLTCLGYVYVIRRTMPKKSVSWLFLLFPGAVSNFLYGQNGFLSAAFLGGGLLLLERYPFVGGSLLGLLSYKPQLAFLVPLALGAGRYWRALAGAVISAVGLALASLLALGSDAWLGFFSNLPLAAGLMARAGLWEKMPTVFAAAQLLGASWNVAVVLQAVATTGAILAVVWVWLRQAPLPIRGSVLALGTILATPYAFAYDLTMVALPFAWLGYGAYANDSKADEVLLLSAWTLIAWSTLGIPGVLQWAGKFPLSQTALVAMLLLALYRAHRPQTPAEEIPPGRVAR